MPTRLADASSRRSTGFAPPCVCAMASPHAKRPPQAMSTLRIPGSGDAPAVVERDVLGALLDVRLAELA